LENFIAPAVEFVRLHAVWAAPVVFALAFAESLALVSLVIPAWGALVAVGGLVGAGAVDFVPVWIAGSVGAALGDWVSYAIGWHYKERAHHLWPLSRYPDMLPKGEAFFQRWGALGVAIGRFSGPLRATVPLAAGIFEMPWLEFQVANVLSAFLWAGVLLAPGTLGVAWLLS
jgi:membrane protein DedA with SNARE-associated domain